ncbi:hypothetical protein LG634_36405 [Streptomyces bambusae]|uniref:hypothetical protein n=1 Tax=Streptomyces bambusae TaxID=1550616 RepID=UPI001CFF87E9|nr:hypothetical protein [Streptomyces bambusae]MCB5170267.1 hypothetical protein [Streptomyces bambusae]
MNPTQRTLIAAAVAVTAVVFAGATAAVADSGSERGLGLENAIQEVGAGQGEGLGGNINNINAVKNDNENTIVRHVVKDEQESAGRLA